MKAISKNIDGATFVACDRLLVVGMHTSETLELLFNFLAFCSSSQSITRCTVAVYSDLGVGNIPLQHCRYGA